MGPTEFLDNLIHFLGSTNFRGRILRIFFLKYTKFGAMIVTKEKKWGSLMDFGPFAHLKLATIYPNYEINAINNLGVYRCTFVLPYAYHSVPPSAKNFWSLKFEICLYFFLKPFWWTDPQSYVVTQEKTGQFLHLCPPQSDSLFSQIVKQIACKILQLACAWSCMYVR